MTTRPTRARRQKPLTIERLESTLDKLAAIIDKHGDVYIPIYERLERELDAMKAERDTKNRISERIARNRSAANQAPAARS